MFYRNDFVCVCLLVWLIWLPQSLQLSGCSWYWCLNCKACLMVCWQSVLRTERENVCEAERDLKQNSLFARFFLIMLRHFASKSAALWSMTSSTNKPTTHQFFARLTALLGDLEASGNLYEDSTHLELRSVLSWWHHGKHVATCLSWQQRLTHWTFLCNDQNKHVPSNMLDCGDWIDSDIQTCLRRGLWLTMSSLAVDQKLPMWPGPQGVSLSTCVCLGLPQLLLQELHYHGQGPAGQ